MDPITRAMFMGSAGAGLEIGEDYEGGYFAGYISQTANGVATHGLIVAPAASIGIALKWKTSDTISPGTSSLFDGAANTANMADTSHPAANYCAGLTIGGYSDWYLPARYELEIAYYNLKPTTDSNNTILGSANPYAVPARPNKYTAGDPSQTSVTAFQSNGAEAFIDWFHWSSSESSSEHAWLIRFDDGTVFEETTKTSSFYVRAFRKFAI
jgi:hypothetical protein